jgi:PAS domain-containing protein
MTEPLSSSLTADLALFVAGVSDRATFLVSPAGAITYWNAGAENVFGYPAGADRRLQAARWGRDRGAPDHARRRVGRPRRPVDGHGSPELTEAALASGFHAVLDKPLRQHELVGALGR